MVSIYRELLCRVEYTGFLLKRFLSSRMDWEVVRRDADPNGRVISEMLGGLSSLFQIEGHG